MGKTRESANLVSDYNIFVDVSNDRIGIGSTVPTVKLDVVGDVNFSGTLYQNGEEFVSGGGLSTVGFSTGYGLHIDPVGAGVTYSENLVVVGNARVTGILSIGTSSIVLNASDNSIKLSSDAVIRRDESTGDIRFLDNSGNLKKIIANEIRVGSGNSISILKSRDGKLVIEDNQGATSGSEHATLQVTGVTTVGGVKIQSGIVTAVSGIVTYYGDGSKLQGVVSGIELQSAGSSVGTGITTINFASGATLTTASAGISTVTISGGGSSSPTIYSDETISNDSGWSGNTTYSCCMRTAGGKKGNTFFFARLEYNTSASQTRLRVYPFTVDRSTGAITWGSATNVWLNTSGAGYSTTYWTGPDGTGAVFAGGHNMYPGYSSHQFGYSKFIVNANGTLSDSGYSYTNADHGYNGMYYTLPTSISTGYFSSAGYNASDSSLAYYRQHYMNGSSISVGSLQSFSSDTSTSYSVGLIAQPGVYQTGTQVCGFIYFRINSSNYRVRALAANGSFTDHAVSNWDSGALAFQMTNGDVILYSSAHPVMRFTAHNSKTDLTTAKSLPGSTGQFGSFMNFGLGNNEFVLSLSSSSPFTFGFPLVKATLNSTTGFSISGVSPVVNPLLALGVNSSYAGMFPLYANANDSNPDKLLAIRHESNFIRAKVTDFPTFS